MARGMMVLALAVTIRLLEAIVGGAAHGSGGEHRAALLQQARMIQCGCRKAIPEARDRKNVEARCALTLK